ncbi:MAG: hypothetical protein M3313_10740 [Actinomycetota bacterium]|nr:hypothetical protein [Actinomycetota bacterium]
MRAALDESADDCLIFFRDDDVGWDDAGLRALLDAFAAHGVPVDLAVIPTALSTALAADLNIAVAAGSVRVHQHGYSHVNHEPGGRKHEFGPSRNAGRQEADIACGRVLLYEALGTAVDPVFTPPWNRCTTETADALVGQGFEVLSRDHTAPRFDRAGLGEVPVTVDWFGHLKGVRWSRPELGKRLAEGVADNAAMGVMLHHAISDAEERSAIEGLLRLVASHPRAQATTILDVSRSTRVASVGSGVPAGAETDRDF